ncbi:GNAT family N-acetyltransferase [Polaromonas sp.]|uniref:GNAT family N-acetyltransferase n=1 Tax=Polaromonas sp. TaxID=1869339 RepID=UPI00286D4C5F|nr:GNAT family N-acetyltransferase [Polaromonas sp.]
MSQVPLIKATPWDMAAFGIPTWELLEYSAAALQQAARTAGHHTLKVDPLADKRLLHEYEFYYCDTLIEPYCHAARLRLAQHPDATISKEIDAEQVLAICHGAFAHGRFHRDFNLSKAAADLRYDNWLKQLLDAQHVYGLRWQGVLAGFIGYSGNNLVLHALAARYRGKGLSKYWWSAVCNALLENGNEKVKSSISVTNLAVLKLYASLGFSFNNSQDVYHRLVP